jgi:hypothetical protein
MNESDIEYLRELVRRKGSCVFMTPSRDCLLCPVYSLKGGRCDQSKALKIAKELLAPIDKLSELFDTK